MSQKISVIIPVYNVEKYLTSSVNSVINQTYKNLEIILVDDGSTDSSGEFCENLAKKDERIKVYHKSNGGLSSARNYGLDKKSGDYVFFLDSDDFIDKTCLEKLLTLSELTSAEIVSCLNKRFKTENELIINSTSDESDIEEFSKESMLANTFKRSENYFVTSWGKLYKSELFSSLRFTEGVIHEDEYICHRFYGQINKFVLLKEELYFYRENPCSITGVKYNTRRPDYLLALKDRVEYFKQYYPNLYTDCALFFAYRTIDLYFEVPKIKGKKAIQKRIKNIYKHAYKSVKGIKTPSQKRFKAFLISPWIYKKVFKK